MKKFESVDYFKIDELISEDEILVRNSVREFVDNEVVPVIESHYQNGTFPLDVIPKLAELGVEVYRPLCLSCQNFSRETKRTFLTSTRTALSLMTGVMSSV